MVTAMKIDKLEILLFRVEHKKHAITREREMVVFAMTADLFPFSIARRSNTV